MPDLKISDLSVDAAPSPSDYMETLDVSDTSMGPAGSNKRVLLSTLFATLGGGGGGGDPAAQGFTEKSVPFYATTAALPSCTYSNGNSGVGAALTAASSGALPAIDGVTPVLSDVVLVKNQVQRLQNGVYKVDQVGDASHPWILTRVAGMDESWEFGGLVAVVDGDVNGQTLWLGISLVVTVGTTPVDFLRIYSPR